MIYGQLSIIFGTLSFILLVTAVFLWFFLDISHYIAVLTGSEARKGVGQIKQSATSGRVQDDLRRKSVNAVISWNTSGQLNQNKKSNTAKMMPNQGMTVLMTDRDDRTMLLAPGEGE